MKVNRIKKDILEVGNLVFSCTIEDFSNLTINKVSKWDSLKHIEFIFGLEEKFNIYFSKSEIPKLTNSAKILSIIKDKLNSKKI